MVGTGSAQVIVEVTGHAAVRDSRVTEHRYHPSGQFVALLTVLRPTLGNMVGVLGTF